QRCDLHRISSVDHDGHFVGFLARVLRAGLESFGMRAMREPAWVQRNHAGPEVVPAEELSAVIEDDFVVVVVVVEEGHFEGARVGFYRTRAEGAYHEVFPYERGVRRRWQVITMAGYRSNVAPVDAHRYQIAMPSDCVQRVVREGDGSELAAAFDN